MNKLFLLLWGITTAFLAQAQTKKNEPTVVFNQPIPTVYMVNLGTFADAKLENFKAFAKLGFIYAEPLDEGQSKVFIGDFEKKAFAQSILKQVQAKGYADARVSEQKLTTNKTTYIQLAAKKIGETINWTAFANAGKVFALANEKEVKIVSAGFANDSLAKAAVEILKKEGFKGAFTKSVPELLLHKVGVFETDSDLTLNGLVEIPKEKPPVITSPVITTVAIPEDNYSGRFSNKQLKIALTAMEYYIGKLDNSNDSKLEKIFAKAKEKDRLLSRYVILAKAMKPADEKFSDLQKAINSIPNNPTLAEQTLKKSSLPIAKAYRAYILFTKNGGDVKEVNKLMSEAVKDAFKGVKENPFNFDPSASYSYVELGQLIQHLRYIQGVAKEESPAPTWLFTEHPKEAKSAFSQGKNYKIVASDEFMNTSEELKMIVEMAQDLNPAWKGDAKQEAQSAEIRTQLYHLPSAAEAKKKDEMKGWNIALWKGLEDWSKKDEANLPLYNAFKATYYVGLQHFEKYFMDKKFSQEEATTLGLNILRQSVGKSLEKFVYLPLNSK